MKKLLIILFALTTNLLSQVYNFHYYNSGNGLTNTSITCIAQDHKGYIWIGTTSNIFRYDGYKFEEVSLWNNQLRTEIVGIAEFNNQVWIATASKGIFVAKQDKEVVNINNRLVNLPQKIKVLRKADDKLIIISQSNDFYHALSDTQVTKILVDANLPQTQFNDIIPIEGGYGIASDDGLLFFQYNRVKYKFNQTKSGKNIIAKALTKDKSNNVVFVSSTGSIYKIENYNLVEIYNANQNYTRFSVIVDQTNSIWAGFNDGIVRIENGKERLIGYANGLPHQVITSLFEDREGNIWIGTLNGVAKLNSLAIKNYPSLFPEVTSSVYKIFRSGREVLVFTDEGISIFRINNGLYTNFPQNFSNPGNVNDVIDLDNNSKLIATNNGLYLWQGNRLVKSPLNSKIGSRGVLSLAKSSENKIYVGTDTGLFVFQNNNLIDYLSIDNELPSNEINAILVTKSDDVWIGTDNGLVKYFEDNVLVLRTSNGLPHNFITSLSEDNEGRIWIGTKKGLSSFKNGRFNNFYPRIKGMNFDEIRDAIPVRDGEVWIATNGGLFIIKNGVEYSSLTSSDGLLSDFITDLEYDQLNDVVFVGTNSGLTTIELKYLKQNKFSYRIYFTGFSTEKRDYNLNQISVSDDEKVIRIFVSLFSFFDEKKIVYRYRLKDIEESWNYLTGINEIIYKNLSPGKYTLIVEASVNGIDWLKNSGELTFEIKSSLLSKLLLYGSFIVGLILLYFVFTAVRNVITSRRIPRETKSEIVLELETEENLSKDFIENLRDDSKVEVIDEAKKRLEEKVESLTKIILEKEKLIEDLKNENISLREKITELENSLNSKSLDFEEENDEFVEKSRIEIIVRNSKEAEEIKKYIEALEKTNWSIRAAAKLLNIPHSTFHYRLKKLNLLKHKQV